MKNLTKLLLGSAMLTLASVASAGIISVSGSGGVVDGSTTNRFITVQVADLAGNADTILDVNLTVDFSKCSAGANAGGCIGEDGFTFNSEIVFDLFHRSTNVDIVNAGTFFGQNGNPRVTQTYDDEAITAVGGTTLQSGSFNPVGSLSDFDGLSALGLWRFTFQDTVGLDALVVHSWTLDIELADVPAPAPIALLGLGMLVLGLRRKFAA